jgi:hypothetical protein
VDASIDDHGAISAALMPVLSAGWKATGPEAAE